MHKTLIKPILTYGSSTVGHKVSNTIKIQWFQNTTQKNYKCPTFFIQFLLIQRYKRVSIFLKEFSMGDKPLFYQNIQCTMVQ